MCSVFPCFALIPWGNAPLIRSKLSTTTLCTSGTYDHDLKQWEVQAVLFCGNIFYLQKISTLVFRLLLRLQASTFICCSPLILQALHKLIWNKLWHCSTTLHSICVYNQFHAGQLIISQPEQILKSSRTTRKACLSFCLTTMYIPRKTKIHLPSAFSFVG